MKRLIKPLWMKVYNLPYLRNTFLSIYHFMHGNHRKISGTDNIIRMNPSTSWIKNVTFEISGDQNIIILEDGARLENVTINIKGSFNHLIMDANCHIAGGYLSFEDYNGRITIGKDTSILGIHIVVSEPGSTVTIDDDCLFSYDIDVRSGDSHSIIDLQSKDRLNYAKDIKIERHVWIGAHVQILKGVVIGHESIIGTGAVVTADVPPNSIAAGIPARVVRQGITWLREKIYLQDAKVPEFAPDFYWAWYQRGEALRRAGYFEEAVVNFDRSIQLKSDDFNSWYTRGLALTQLGRYLEAVASFDQALQIRPNHYQTWCDRAEALIELEHHKQALTSYQKALK